MKVFFQASHIERKKYEPFYKKIYEEIIALGYSHVSDEIVNVTTSEFYKNVQKGGKEASEKLYQENERKIQEADIVVFETSVPSAGIGFLIQRSLDHSKPTILLYHEGSPTYLFLGAKEDKLIVNPYNEKTLTTVLKDALNQAKEKRDKRFNFFISPRLLTYLDEQSRRLSITKSKFIRDLIIDYMQKQKDSR